MALNLSNLHPNLESASPSSGIQEIMRSLLVRTNLVPGIRHSLGWRGLKDCSGKSEAWTAKIDGMQGVFGLCFDQIDFDENWWQGEFDLCYFPAPEEDLVDRLSVHAGILTQQPEYLETIRAFSAHPGLSDAFRIGTLHLSINPKDNKLHLGLEALSSQTITSDQGIVLSQDKQKIELVKPGGIDQDFPAFDVAMAFYRVLAASVSFNLGRAPDSLQHESEPAHSFAYNAEQNQFQKISSRTITHKTLWLGYGDEEISARERLAANAQGCCWQEGEVLPESFQSEPWWEAHTIGNVKPGNRELSGVDNRPHLIVVSGFLGSGKTSFLQHFIEYQVAMNRFTAVIQNEIGEVGLDARLLDQDFAVTEMDEGCVCCTLVGNLRTAVTDILEKYKPDFIILETTGLANPFNLLEELNELSELVRFDSVTTLVDGLNIEESLDRYETAINQIQAADLLVLNKSDLLTETDQHRLRQKLQQLNPEAPVIQSSHGDVNPSLLYNAEMQGRDGASPTIGAEAAVQHSSPTHHHSHQADGLSSLKIDCLRPLEKDCLIELLEEMPREVFRIKGVIDLKPFEVPMLVQFVGGRFEISQYPDPECEQRYLIVIGQNPDTCSAVKALKKHLNVAETNRVIPLKTPKATASPKNDCCGGL